MLKQKQQTIDLGSMSIKELKATAFDLREQMDSLNNGLAQIRMMIAEKTKEENQAVGVPVNKETAIKK